jgi:predicted CopG family antitoxin
MEVLKPQNRSTDEIIRYLLDIKKQGIEQSIAFSKTEEFQVVRKKLKELNKKNAL